MSNVKVVSANHGKVRLVISASVGTTGTSIWFCNARFGASAALGLR